jgi:hypothetical protein
VGIRVDIVVAVMESGADDVDDEWEEATAVDVPGFGTATGDVVGSSGPTTGPRKNRE